MFNEDFWQSKNRKKEITVGWLYNNNIKDDFAKGYTKNMTDYWSVELGVFFSKQFASDTIFDLLTQAHKDGFSQIIVFKQGTTLRGPNFLPEFKKFHEANPDAKFIGHVLDRQEGYYEVHPQAFFIDLNWWAETGFPEWGERTGNSPLETIVPIRSKENHHDQYTPHWIAPGKDLKTYQELRGEGWNIVKALIESGEKVLSWPHECRVAKQYAYAEVKEDGPRHRAQFLDEVQVTNSFFIANTETFPENLLEEATSRRRWPLFEQIVCPASGLTALIFAFKLGLKRQDTVLIYDVSQSALEYTLKIFDEYDPNTSYIEFAKKMIDSAEGINFKGQNQLINSQELIDELNKEGFAEWKKEEFSLMNIRIEHLNLFDVHRYKGLTRRIENKMTYIHLSNIFHYMPTSFYYSLQQRYELGRELLHKLHERSIDNNMLVYNADCNSDFKRLDWIDKHITRTDFSELSEQHIFRLLKWNK